MKRESAAPDAKTVGGGGTTDAKVMGGGSTLGSKALSEGTELDAKTVGGGNTPDIKILVTTHMEYGMPDDPVYVPLWVGAAGRKKGWEPPKGYLRDDTGDNISRKNGSFCELTGLYWAWKNLDADYIGLAHYRRHFASTGINPVHLYWRGARSVLGSFFREGESAGEGFTIRDAIRSGELAGMLPQTRLFLPKKRRYVIETLYSHYAHTHYAYQLDEAGKAVRERCPEYRDSFERAVRQRAGYMFNMAIMERELFDDYCGWLFGILFELEGRMDAGRLSPYQGRVFGRLGEILMNVWVRKQLEDGVLNRNEVKELHLIHLGRIDWKNKAGSFLRAKFLHKRYTKGF